MKRISNRERMVGELLATRAGCPTAGELNRFADRRIDAVDRERIAEHIASCESCNAATIFLEHEAAAESVVAPDPPSGVVARSERLIEELSSPRSLSGDATRHRWTWGLGLAAAAALVLAVALLPETREPTMAPDLRGDGESATRSLLDERVAVPRDAFVLRWTAAAEGSRYDLTVLDDRLVQLYAARGLEQPEHRVPLEALAAVSSGTRLHWQIETSLPDGRRATSMTFFARVE